MDTPDEITRECDSPEADAVILANVDPESNIFIPNNYEVFCDKVFIFSTPFDSWASIQPTEEIWTLGRSNNLFWSNTFFLYGFIMMTTNTSNLSHSE